MRVGLPVAVGVSVGAQPGVRYGPINCCFPQLQLFLEIFEVRGHDPDLLALGLNTALVTAYILLYSKKKQRHQLVRVSFNTCSATISDLMSCATCCLARGVWGGSILSQRSAILSAQTLWRVTPTAAPGSNSNGHNMFKRTQEAKVG